MTADSIKIESDEDGFHLVLQLDEEIPLVTNEGRLDVRIDGCAEALHEQVNLIIGGWLAEGEAAARTFRCDPDESGGVSAHLAESRAEEQWKEDKHGYALDDPKHENFHSVHADHYDNREKV